MHLRCDGNIADTYRRNICRIFAQCLRDKTGRVREVDQHGPRFGNFFDVLRNFQNHWNGPQSFCHPTNACRFLADQAVPQTKILIPAASFHMTNAQLGCYIGGVFNRLTLIVCENHFEGRAFGFYHALRKPAYNF